MCARARAGRALVLNVEPWWCWWCWSYAWCLWCSDSAVDHPIGVTESMSVLRRGRGDKRRLRQRHISWAFWRCERWDRHRMITLSAPCQCVRRVQTWRSAPNHHQMDNHSFQQTLHEQAAIFYATFPATAAAKYQEEARYHTALQLYCKEVPLLEYAYSLKIDQSCHVAPPPLPPQPLPPATPGSGAKMSLGPLQIKQPHQKRHLACHFCHGRKIGCSGPLPGSPDESCKSVLPFVSPSLVLTTFFSQCQLRSLPCQYPARRKHGMRKKKQISVPDADSAPGISTTTTPKGATLPH